jgi:hypothetical protein
VTGGTLHHDELVDDRESTKPRWIDRTTLKKEDISDLQDDLYHLITHFEEYIF